MTLVEVMVAFLIMSLFAVSAFSLTLQSQKGVLSDYYRLEAYRIAQTISEQAMQASFPGNFTAAYLTSSDNSTRWTWTADQSANLRMGLHDRSAKGLYATGRSAVTFRKEILDPASPGFAATGLPANIGSASVLAIRISWRFAGKDEQLVLPVIRGGN